MYVNHARFINMNNDTYAWINVIRNPVDRWNSLHYYNVGSLRGGLAKLELGRRKQDKRCGCANMEFYECIQFRYTNGCELTIPSQMDSFCTHDQRCTVEAAIRNARMYAAIGLTEEIDVTIELFERKLAPFFAGATAVVGSAKWNGAKRSTKQLNPLTNTAEWRLARQDTRSARETRRIITPKWPFTMR